MDIDMHVHVRAVRRYGAMTGNLTELSEDEQEQAFADRELFEQYLPAHEHGWDQSALLLRFMHEVCLVPLWQARECAVVIVRKSDAFRLDCKHAENIASCILQDTGNALMAEAVASIYQSAAEGTEWESFWKDVLEALWYGQPRGEEKCNESGATLH